MLKVPRELLLGVCGPFSRSTPRSLRERAWITGFDTGVVFCAKRDFAAIGGYDETRLYAEDVAFLLALRRHGKVSRRKLTRLRGVRTILSTRKFDRWGDWHFFTRMPAAGWRVLRDPSGATAFAKEYWYGKDR
ncbi:MAG: hypothetical protein ABI639_12330 [Thermoanaerobaculia bacterium]